LWLFHRAGLDAGVREVGLGGRLEAAYIGDADVAVVTSIGVDHAEDLRGTRDSVGSEKAGIMRPSGLLVCSETDLPPRFAAEVARLQVQMWQRGRDYSWQQQDGSWELTGQRGGAPGRVGLPPISLPRDNLATAVQAFWA